jgi:glycosyltransferase involved in cell wall biosynthesis
MEGLPSVVLEAMASGMPVITTETCGMPDIVDHEISGLLIPQSDCHAIESAVLRLYNAPALREKLGAAASEKMKRYTWERSALQLQEFYRSIILKERNGNRYS